MIFRIKKTDCTGPVLAVIEARSPEDAAYTYARRRKYDGITRATGDAGKSGCFRGVDYRAGVEHCGDLFHVGMA